MLPIILADTGATLNSDAFAVLFNDKDAKKVNLTKDVDNVLLSAVNFYGPGVTTADVENFYKAKISPDPKRPLSYGLNSQLVKQGNALFGEWTWKNNAGLKPKYNKDAKFSVKVFYKFSDSVNSYILNLNSHPAYKKMRDYRTIAIKEDKILSGYDTSNYLDQYAEIGYEYVLKVTSMIKNNKFDKFDNIKLEKLN